MIIVSNMTSHCAATVQMREESESGGIRKWKRCDLRWQQKMEREEGGQQWRAMEDCSTDEQLQQEILYNKIVLQHTVLLYYIYDKLTKYWIFIHNHYNTISHNILLTQKTSQLYIHTYIHKFIMRNTVKQSSNQRREQDCANIPFLTQ